MNKPTMEILTRDLVVRAKLFLSDLAENRLDQFSALSDIQTMEQMLKEMRKQT